MISVSQDWIDNSHKQLRSEGNVRISFYTDDTYTTQSFSLDKNELQDFSYERSGSITNAVVPSFFISIKIFKQLTSTYSIKPNDYAKIEFGFFLDDEWEWHEVSRCQVKEIQKPANGLLDTIIFDFLGFKKLDETYSKGSYGMYADYPLAISTRPLNPRPSLMELLQIYPFTYTYLLVGESQLRHNGQQDLLGGSLSSEKKINILQMLADWDSKTLNITYQNLKGVYTQNDKYDVRASFITIDKTISTTNAYEITSDLSYNFPEFTTGTKYKEIKQYIYYEDSSFTANANIHYSGAVSGTEYVVELSPQIRGNIVGLSSSINREVYGNSLVFTNLTGSGDLEFTYDSLNYNKKAIERTIDNNETDIFEVDNLFSIWNNPTDCSNLVNWLNNSTTIDIDFRIDPRLELFDKVKVVARDGSEHYGIVEAFTINFKGAFTGKATIREFTPLLRYKATFKNYDGTILEETYYESGETPSFGGDTPTKPSTATQDFEFSGWSPSLEPITEDTEYVAQFNTINKYTIRFLNYDGSVLQTMVLRQGSTPSYSGNTPTKPSTTRYDYEFSSWSPTISAVSQDQDYTAQFTSYYKYLIKFVNYDGTTLQSSYLRAGATPVYSGATPSKPSITTATYTYKSWDKTIAVVSADTTYTAQFYTNYRIRFYNYDGTLLQSKFVRELTIPHYTGTTPSRPDTEDTKYTYTGFGTITISSAPKDYTAHYSITYRVRFISYNGGILQTSWVASGDTPSYTGATPTKPSGTGVSYTFTGWSPAIAPISSPMTYLSQFSAIYNPVAPTGGSSTLNYEDYDDSWTFSITNPNDYTVNLFVYCSQGLVIQISMNAHETRNFNNLDNPELQNSIEEYHYGSLQDPVYGWVETYGEQSQTKIFFEER